MHLTRLLFLLLRLVVSLDGLNTCQFFNLDEQKSKRIEAVRGQILSKLRIRSPPAARQETPPTDTSVPPEVMLLYNSTRELLKERARQAESACDRESSEEDYYAKEVQRIDVVPPPAHTSESLSIVPGLHTGPGTELWMSKTCNFPFFDRSQACVKGTTISLPVLCPVSN